MMATVLLDKLREYAQLLRRWEAFELGGPAPMALDYLDLAKTIEEAISLIEHLQFARDRIEGQQRRAGEST